MESYARERKQATKVSGMARKMTECGSECKTCLVAGEEVGNMVETAS